MKSALRVLTGAAVCAALALTPRGPHRTRGAEACGPDFGEPLFVPLRSPANAAAFAAGTLGVLQPTYRVEYLVAAWRQLSGVPLSQDERAAITSIDAEVGARPPQPDAAIESWKEARKRVTPGEPPRIDASRFSETYEYILICPADAFITAARALDERVARSGAAAPDVIAWLQAQDQVFANCRDDAKAPAVIPAALSSDASAAARADRAYQIAAAQFYAGRWDDAATGFTAVGADPQSPWRTWGRYLAGRAALRRAALGDAAGRAAALARAESDFGAVIADPALADRHASAQGLLQLTRLRSNPRAAFVAMAGDLAGRTRETPFRRALVDFRLLFATIEPAALDSDEARGDDLSDWIVTLRNADASLTDENRDRDTSRTANAADHAAARWKATGSLPWLTAAMMVVPSGHPAEAALTEAASSIESSSPAWPTLVFNRVRLLLVRDQLDAARSLLTEIRKTPAPADPAFDNFLRAAELRVATSLDTLLAASVRTALGDGGDTEQITAIEKDRNVQLGDDAIDVLNERLPLSLLVRAAEGATLPDQPRRRVVRAAFTRALLLGDTKLIAASAAPMVRIAPELVTPLRAVTGATTADARRDEAALLLVLRPGLRPFVTRGWSRNLAADGSGKDAPLTELDQLRDNWWCDVSPTTASTPSRLPSYETSWFQRTNFRLDQATASLYGQPNAIPWPTFLSAGERAQTEREWAALDKVEAAPTYLGRVIVAWAKAHPDDPRAPEALHRVVRATRYGCTDEATGGVSRAAFELLHSRYPKSEWAARTKYWFK